MWGLWLDINLVFKVKEIKVVKVGCWRVGLIRFFVIEWGIIIWFKKMDFCKIILFFKLYNKLNGLNIEYVIKFCLIWYFLFMVWIFWKVFNIEINKIILYFGWKYLSRFKRVILKEDGGLRLMDVIFERGWERVCVEFWLVMKI